MVEFRICFKSIITELVALDRRDMRKEKTIDDSSFFP